MVFHLADSKDLKFEDINIGDEYHFTVKITSEKLEYFASLSGDYNPLHMDEQYAQKSKFKQRVCHGMLLSSYFSQLVGMYMPGKRCLYLSQTLNFLHPCFINDEILVKGTVTEKSDSTKILEIKTTISNQNNVLLVDGKAKVMLLENTTK